MDGRRADRKSQAAAALVALALLGTLIVAASTARPARAAVLAPPTRVITYDVAGRSNSSDLEAFAAQVAETYADPRGWSFGGSVQFLRVPSGGAFTVWLSAAARVPEFGSPCSTEYSCTQGRNVIINESRWLGGSAAWNASGATLRDYRHMVVNHETGHWIGFGHAFCAGPGQPAPVMQQQSISLQGCAPNPWPLDGERAAAAARLGVEIRYGAPQGVVDAITPWWHGVRVSGWAIDPDTAGPTIVMVSVDGALSGGAAAVPRPDVAAAFPGYGPFHGFDVVIVAGEGSHQVCVDAVNVAGRGTNAHLDCRTVVVGSPFGAFESAATGPSVVAVRGWAIDPDTTDPVDVHVYVDGAAQVVHTTVARPDLAGAYPGAGAAHGFDALVPAPAGTHQVCIYGIDRVGPGANAILGCRPVVVGGSPFGALDSAVPGPRSVRVRGWAIDRDTAAPIKVHVYVDGTASVVTADGARPDLAQAFPLYGAPHGFDAVVPATPGIHSVCAYGIDGPGPGDNSGLGCRLVVVGGSPFGALDAVTPGSGTVRVRGWAIDPDTAAPIKVHVYVDGTVSVVSADGARPDLAGGYPQYGANHGFDATIAAPAGPRRVCAYAIDGPGPGTNTTLRCTTANVR